ncbi:hypothetical protein D5S17_19100 [Pseudonocardiaceae bacterium YIM PH 21723]|nr:hypothetical protein D5S17_19100 [Pseudonocardiaceae bacterium YIM PH 21723]
MFLLDKKEQQAASAPDEPPVSQAQGRAVGDCLHGYIPETGTMKNDNVDLTNASCDRADWKIVGIKADLTQQEANVSAECGPFEDTEAMYFARTLSGRGSLYCLAPVGLATVTEQQAAKVGQCLEEAQTQIKGRRLVPCAKGKDRIVGIVRGKTKADADHNDPRVCQQFPQAKTYFWVVNWTGQATVLCTAPAA